jgi:hypothetical protein
MAAVVLTVTLQCWKDLHRVRQGSAPQAMTLLLKTLNDIARYPTLPGSKLSFHDRSDPIGRCYIVSPFTILYSITTTGRVVFTNVWRTPSTP